MPFATSYGRGPRRCAVKGKEAAVTHRRTLPPPAAPSVESLLVSPVSEGSHREHDTQRARHQSVTSKTDPFEVRIVDRCFPRESKPISHEY